MTTISLKIPRKLKAQIEAAARAKRISKSQYVREAVENEMKGQRKQKRPTAFDLVGHLAGSVKGPRDLLTNPKYMEDFGA